MSTQRRQSRELALQVEFQREFLPQFNIEQSLANFSRSFTAPSPVWDYAKEILFGIERNKEQIDNLINASSANWNIERMALVDVNVLRIAIYEIMFSNDAIPPKVAVNEAIEISKKYGSTESSNFINGLLADIVKDSNI